MHYSLNARRMVIVLCAAGLSITSPLAAQAGARAGPPARVVDIPYLSLIHI